jgi:hypothetical protein
MKRLIFTTSDSGAGCLRQPGVADMVMPLGSRFFLREPLPSDVEIASSLEEDDWLGRIYRKYAQETDRRTRTVDLCEPFDTVDLWIDPDPNAQWPGRCTGGRHIRPGWRAIYGGVARRP